MNAALRAGDTDALRYYDAHIRAATSWLNQLPPFEGQVCRGVSVYDPQVAGRIAESYQPGTIVAERPFTSTSASNDANFDGLVQFTIESRSGRDVTDLSHSWSGLPDRWLCGWSRADCQRSRTPRPGWTARRMRAPPMPDRMPIRHRTQSTPTVPTRPASPMTYGQERRRDGHHARGSYRAGTSAPR